MEDELKATIQKAISDDLPRQVGDELKKRLKIADQLEKDNFDLAKALDEKTKACNIAMCQSEAKGERLLELEKEAASVQEQKERNEQDFKQLELQKLRVRLEESEKRADFAQETALGLVRNTTFKKHHLANNQEPGGSPVNDQYGNTQFPITQCVMRDETTTVTEE